MATLPVPATASKEKGNAAFKAGDYAAAVGHYTAAALADPSDPTFFLNRAAAYLKLSKNEDAERDCTAVLSLSNKNVKALFRRAQARVALQKLGDAHNDLQKALRVEPNNEAVKAELARVDDLIVSKKGRTRSAPLDVSAPPPPSPSSLPVLSALPNPRRVPVTINDDGPSSPSTSITTAQHTDDLLSPISSRALSTSSMPPDRQTASATPAPAMQKPKAASFVEAKHAREAKSAGRVGGGIFRMSGNDTVIKTREVLAPAVADPPKHPVPAPAPAPTLVASTLTPTAAARTTPAIPRTLFDFTRAWDRIPSSDTAARWALLNTSLPASLPALFGASLEPALLASFIPVFASVSAPAAPGQHENAPHDADAVRAREFMCALTQVPRFRTVAQFLSRAERSAARAVWETVVQGSGSADAEDARELADAARIWGFADT
ncbi:hypothetical protein F5148DRAFT_1281149 [Russula earlei]|uniref:Uncharacterized protein n=1 Tax=Russula earlei TaxID=71964 RepID=A0ACC0UH71_9AGAM|nr:hypothetical protein F5148DRAFT_1281149 [Russula earlei]